ncbi:MAG: hypothetical protein WD673_14530 [Alphaproteobacteria bacterium]
MSDTVLVQCSVLDVHPVNMGRLLALAAVEIDVKGAVIVIEGVQVVRFPATRVRPEMTRVDLPRYRGRDGV